MTKKLVMLLLRIQFLEFSLISAPFYTKTVMYDITSLAWCLQKNIVL